MKQVDAGSRRHELEIGDGQETRSSVSTSVGWPKRPHDRAFAIASCGLKDAGSAEFALARKRESPTRQQPTRMATCSSRADRAIAGQPRPRQRVLDIAVGNSEIVGDLQN